MTAMTFRRHLARCLTRNLLLVGLVVGAGVSLEATTDVTQGALPAGVSECWFPDTAQIKTVVGECP